MRWVGFDPHESFHHAITSYPFRYGLGRTRATRSAFRIHRFGASSYALLEPKPGRLAVLFDREPVEARMTRIVQFVIVANGRHSIVAAVREPTASMLDAASGSFTLATSPSRRSLPETIRRKGYAGRIPALKIIHTQ